MDMQNTVAAALAGSRPALLALAARRGGWARAEMARLGRGEPAMVARAQTLAAAFLAGRSTTAIEPMVVGEHSAKTLAQLARCLDHDDAVAGALCANGHPGWSQPVGSAVAYREHISVSGVGFDIGAGTLALRTDEPFGSVRERVSALLDAIYSRLSFGLWRRQGEDIEHHLFDDRDAWEAAGARALLIGARDEFGTIGAGSHHVSLLREVLPDTDDDQAPVWIVVHAGSRGLGHRLAVKYLRLAGGERGYDARPTLLHQNTDLARAYLAAMELAGRYADAGREWVAQQVLRALGGRQTDHLHSRHNQAWREEVNGAPGWVTRKGCAPFRAGQRRFISGAMGEDAVIVEGTASPQATALLHSVMSGPGRTLSRSEAQRRIIWRDLYDRLHERGVQLRGGDLDEAPMAHRCLDTVLAHHATSLRVTQCLRSFGVMMARVGVVDPYRHGVRLRPAAMYPPWRMF